MKICGKVGSSTRGDSNRVFIYFSLEMIIAGVESGRVALLSREQSKSQQAALLLKRFLE